MIPELYGKNKTRTSGNRIAYLPDCISCTVTEERNGVFECFMQYPVTGAGFSRIQLERIISVKPNHSMSDQLFRIYRISKPMNRIVSIYAQHISYDLSFKPVMPFTQSGITPSLLLSNLLEGTGFESGTNISASKAFDVKEPKSVRACLGGSDGSVLSIWNGEFTFDNFLVSFRSARGADRGVCIEYGKNMTDLEYDSDNSTVYTDVLPYAFINEQCITLNEKTISIADPGVTVQKTLFLDLSDQFSGSDSITQAQLRNAANAYITNNGVGTLLPSITVSFEPEAVGNSILDNVNLCDTVTVKYPDYDIEAKAKVTKTVYDPLLERYESITLGNAKSSMAETLQKQIADVGKKNEHVIDRFATIMESAINDATESITGGAGGNVVIHQDASGKPYEILIMDTDDISTAQKVWRWNSGGLGYSSNGYSGPFTTAITAQGQIVADFITTGQLTANLLKAGTIASFDNSSYWNLENGNIKVTGDIVANSLSLGSGVTIPYSKISSRPDLTIYIQKDGTIGTTPAEGATGFKVSSAGLLQAANAVIYGKLYASGGKIANFEIAGNTLPSNGFWKNTLSVINVNSSAGKQYAAFIRGGSAHNNAVIGIKEMASSEESNNTNWNDVAEYNFYVRADGKMMAKNAEVTGDITANSLTLGSGVTVPYSKISSTPDLTLYVKKDGTIGSTPAEGATGFKVSSAGLLQAANAVIYGKLYASGGKIANFEIAGNTLPENGFWKNTLSAIHVNTSANKQYAAFVRGGAAHDNVVLGIKEMASNKASNSTNWNDVAEYNFYVRADGKMMAKNADVTGDITANSLTLGSGVTVPYSKISSTPDLTVYVKKDGTIGSTPADGATGFKVSSAGVLQASNAVIYGKIYASGGTIGGWDISANKITNTSASGYEVGIANFNNTDASSRVFYCLNTETNKNVFRVNRNGHVEAADLKITGGSISIGSNFNVDSNGICDASALTASGLIATDAVVTGLSLIGDMEMTTGSLIKMYCGNSWNIVFRYYNNAVCVGADAKVLRLCGSAAYLGSSGTTAVTSDARMKRDITPLDEKRETFFGLLEPVNYKYNEGHRTHTGFIAQQVKEAADEAEIDTEDLAAYVNIINDDESVEHALRYEEFIALNTHMIQKLMKRVDELEQRVQELEARQ